MLTTSTNSPTNSSPQTPTASSPHDVTDPAVDELCRLLAQIWLRVSAQAAEAKS